MPESYKHTEEHPEGEPAGPLVEMSLGVACTGGTIAIIWGLWSLMQWIVGYFQ